ncbi:hypothetical protein [Caulobacter sp. BP25]|uniref:hypothetical protein n=1 Tax=Caulobacter sp. BP25 TaxID=2048900 RepID=UPI000C12C03E|nr:hypothetical protein [Caulobacter sp. BP25]PHY18029.1 hypothetical protein CSW59_14675 [Caulobacter sp. BP25]
MTKLSTAVLGASLLILSLAAPALADETKPASPKARAPLVKTLRPASSEAKDRDDHGARRVSEDRDDQAHGEKHNKARRHDRD